MIQQEIVPLLVERKIYTASGSRQGVVLPPWFDRPWSRYAVRMIRYRIVLHH